MGSKIEYLVVMRQRGLQRFLVGFVIWSATNIVNQLIISTPLNRLLVLVGLVGWAIWMRGIWDMYRLQQVMQKDPQAALALNDERVQADRGKAAFIALGAVGLLHGILLPILIFQPTLLSGALVAQLTILTLSATFIGAFLRRDKENDSLLED